MSHVRQPNTPDAPFFPGKSEAGDGTANLPAIAVLGQYRGGTSCTAGVLGKLGVYMGGCLRWPSRANPTGYWESRRLARLCRRLYDEPALTLTRRGACRRRRIEMLGRWCDRRRRKARGRHPAVAGKHPLLCLMGPELLEAWGRDVRFIAVERPIEESLASLEKLGYWGWSAEAAAAAVERLVHERDRFLAGRRHLRLAYHALVEDPASQIDRIIAFANLPATAAQRQEAIAFVDPALRRVVR